MTARLPLALLLAVLPLAAQRPAGQKPPTPAKPSAEQQDLERALASAGGSPVEYLRAIERHLAKYPDTTRRAELEGAAARAAMEAGDDRAVVQYGERVLTRRPDDLGMLAAVTHSLLASQRREASEGALQYARHAEELLLQRLKELEHLGASGGDLRDAADRELSVALRNESRANGDLGRPDEAALLARRSFETFPNAESAREVARWCERLDKALEAATALADAMTVPDPRATADDRARDRARMGELYRQAKGSEAGLGDLVLEAFDRNIALVHTRQLRLRAGDPNAGIADPMQFTLTGQDGGKFEMASLRGKVVVLDFWATWCAPCRQQHPLLDRVRKQFASNPEVVFLSIDTDEDRNAVKRFLNDARWEDRVYFEDGLSRALGVMSIPATIVFGRDGKVFSRLTGFVPGQFVETLTQRISDALR